jgi:nucleotide-binding universal stress UspA family protein
MQESKQSGMRGVVVVGVDGSAGAREALRWAAAEARLRRTRLRVVHVTTSGFFGAGGAGYGYPYISGSVDTLPGAGFSDLRHAADDLLDEAIADVEADGGGLEIERQIVEGGAVEVLVHAVAEGDLLVVGSRGHGGFAGLLLGSVSQQCAHHAPCPVVIVHPAKPSTTGSKSARAAQTESESAA